MKKPGMISERIWFCLWPWLVALGLIIFLGLMNGCVLTNLGLLPIDAAQQLIPAQLQAYKDAGFKIYDCFTIAGGPPAQGKFVAIKEPSDSQQQYSFANNCEIVQPQAPINITIPATQAAPAPTK